MIFFVADSGCLQKHLLLFAIGNTVVGRTHSILCKLVVDLAGFTGTFT